MSQGPRPGFWKRAGLLVLLISLASLLQLPGPCGPALEWRDDLEGALAEALAASRPAALSFRASWCSACSRFERRTLRQSDVVRELERFERVEVDVSLRTPRSQELMGRYRVYALPALVLIDSGGTTDPESSLEGFVTAGELLPRLRAVR